MTAISLRPSVTELVNDPQIWVGCQALADAIDRSPALPVLALLRAVIEDVERQEQGGPGGADPTTNSQLPDLTTVSIALAAAVESIDGGSTDVEAGGTPCDRTHPGARDRGKLTATRRTQMPVSLETGGQC